MNPLLKLLALNKDKAKQFRSESASDGVSLYIYDVIVSDDLWGGISAQQVVKQFADFAQQGNPDVHLRINSPGGDVFAARAMVQAIKDYKGKVIAHVDGYAASAATFLVVAADQSLINEGGMFMIHNAWTIAAGNANDFINTADLLERIDITLRNDYSNKTGQKQDQIKEWMDAETYFFGQEAVDAGFVDAVATASPKNEINWDMSAYKRAPKQNLSEPEKDTELEPEKPDLSAHYRQLEVVNLTA